MEMISAKFIQNSPLNGSFGPTSREQIAAVFRARARGVDAKTADDRTKAYYRSSGLQWALALG